MAKYRQIREDLRALIESGEYGPRALLPSLTDLTARYRVARNTATQALKELEQEGLIQSEGGRGWIVRPRPRPRRHGIDRYSRSTWAAGKAILIAETASQGMVARQQIRELAEVEAPEVVAVRLGIPVGTTVWVRRRTTFIEDRAHQLADSYYPLDLVEGTAIRQVDTGPGGGFARLEESGERLDEINEELAARMPTSREAIDLSLPPGTPVVELIRTTYDISGRAVEVMWSIIAGDMSSFSYRFKIPD
ncbi:UTRA domain-containing protein [Herbidospora sp. NEAU-GS84]|uniref:UTRA domain-containing protein n=1 Tax=Herbidospora solisilvae TaxID=2696284 RepID=A0A7C9NHB6_9ACTN|nr:GntR family transcriptional regulator [Herbidospora solisilvae]NAS22512.1 UTRA domain-containing protein [Herbidospora solisilvae]